MASTVSAAPVSVSTTSSAGRRVWSRMCRRVPSQCRGEGDSVRIAASTPRDARATRVPPALAVSDLRKRYGRIDALRGVDLEVAPGELFGLLGPNGAGKSTLVKIACGLVRATGGRA